MADSNTVIPTTLLLVDEQKLVHHGVAKMLSDAPDITIHSCDDGLQAIAIAEQLSPTVILQDINMPDINGLELLAEYRQRPALTDIPVIILSGTSTAEVKADAFRRGADDYIVKMPHPVELIARLRHHSHAYIEHIEREKAVHALEQERQKLTVANTQLELQQRELNEAYTKLERMSALDGLTQIYNRHYFDETYAKEWSRAMRETEPLSLIMIDVDFFKRYNDSYGHQAGDECLKLIASTLKEHLQRPTDFVARYGGEEFIVVLSGTHAPGALKVAERLRQHIHALCLPHENSDTDEYVTISLGAACTIPMVKHQPGELLLAADQALYAAKHAGRNRVHCADL